MFGNTALEIIDSKPFKISEGRVFENGSFGIGICPGHSARLDIGARCLSSDLAAVKEWGASLIVTLITKPEFKILGVLDFEDKIKETGIDWLHFPIHDGGVPNAGECNVFERMIETISNEIMSNRKVFIHCRGGLGRSGLVVCQALKRMGFEPKKSLKLARSWRRGAVENKIQENFVLNSS